MLDVSDNLSMLKPWCIGLSVRFLSVKVKVIGGTVSADTVMLIGLLDWHRLQSFSVLEL